MNKKVVLVICIAVFLIASLNAYAETCTEFVKECRYNDEQSCRMAITSCVWDGVGCRPVQTCQSYAQYQGYCGDISFCASHNQDSPYSHESYSCWSCTQSSGECGYSQECLPRTPAPYCLPGVKKCAWSQGPSRYMITCTGQNAPYSWQFLQDCPSGVCYIAGINNPQCFECDQDKDGYWRMDQAPNGLNYCKTPLGGGDCADTAADCTNAVALPSGQDYCKANLGKIHPQAKEICNNYVDDDCDTKIDFNDGDCNCSEPYTTGPQKNSCQDLDDFSNMNPSNLEGELGTNCSAYKGGNKVSDSCYTGALFDKKPEKYKYVYMVWEADCGMDSNPISNRRLCPESQTVCFQDECVDSGKLYNWSEIKEGRPNVIFIPGQFGWYKTFNEFYNAYKNSYNIYYFAPIHLEDDGVNAAFLNEEIRNRLSKGELKQQVNFITFSRGHFRLKMAVILSAELQDFYKNAVIFSISPPLGGSQFAFGWFKNLGSDVLQGAHWIFDMGLAMSPTQYTQKYYAEKSDVFLNSVKDYYTFVVRGDAHLAGVWDYMNPQKTNNEKDQRLKTWYENYIKTRGRHHYEYYLYPSYGFADRHGKTADLTEVIGNWDTESENYISIYGLQNYLDDWVVDSSGLKGKKYVEHEFLLLYPPLINKIKSVIDSSGAPLLTGMAVSDDVSGNITGNISFTPCDVEKARLDLCINLDECDVMCNATDNVSGCIDFCYNDSEFCHDIFKDELDYCNSLQKEAEERGEGQVTPIVPVTEECKESWSCTAWLPEVCPENEIQTRACEELNKCGTEKLKPVTERNCVYIPAPQKNITVQIPQQVEEAEQPQPAFWGVVVPVFLVMLIILINLVLRKTKKK